MIYIFDCSNRFGDSGRQLHFRHMTRELPFGTFENPAGLNM